MITASWTAVLDIIKFHRARQASRTAGAMSANRSSGNPTARIAPSLNTSRSIDFTLKLPGSSRIAAKVSAPFQSGSVLSRSSG